MPIASPGPVIVAGDLSLDRLLVPLDTTVGSSSAARLIERPGGALLLAHLLRGATARSVITCDLDQLGPRRLPQTIAQLDRFPAGPGKPRDTVLRVCRRFDLTDATTGAPPALPQDDPAAALVVLDDRAAGFRDSAGAWPAVLTNGAQPVVVCTITGSVARGALWAQLRERHADRLVAIVSADDLREDANISRGLSWERTATDLLWQLASNSRLIPLAGCAHLIVRFGLDGAVHYTAGGRKAALLYYDPAVAEDGFSDDHPGEMIGCGRAFAAAIAARIAQDGIDAVGDAVAGAIGSARQLLRDGFGDAADTVPVLPPISGAPSGAHDRISAIEIPAPGAGDAPDPDFWCILSSLSSRRLEQISFDIVRRGDTDALTDVPVGRFGALQTIDRTEIESFRSIRRLMLTYCRTENPGRPLSIAVFGPPGSGKSFGVAQVAHSVAPGRIEKRDFNLSQFSSPADLTAAFHWVRDVALSGKIALAVFDEFDSSLQGARLGWLKSFLAPMQDGAFKEGEAMHPLGRAIFVFAGGTCSTYEEFCCGREESASVASKAFREAKGPDFASRLRGYVDVLGPNPVGEDDRFHLVRRAMLLRSLLTRKLSHLIDDDGHARVDGGVLRALLKAPHYRHGARSMEAILDMSALPGRRSFDQAALPPAEQLDLHTDAGTFSKLVSRDVLFGAGRERIARAIHEKYRASQVRHKPENDPALVPWEQLSETLKESNRHQADQIPEKLTRISCGFAPAGHSDDSFTGFTAEEIEILSEMEHERWVSERRAGGWTKGARDVAAKRTPHLVPWAELDEKTREYDRTAVRTIPPLMAEAGFEIYRLD